MMADGGKGSAPRPYSVKFKDFDNSYETIFGKKPPKEQYVPPPLPEELQQEVSEVKDSTQGG